MNIIFYIIIFILGTILGSFYATAINRVIKEKKVFAIHSYCTNCGEKLKILERIPIISYIFLKGKCKHCKEKIKYPYIILEILTGVLFLALAYGLKITNMHINKLISFIFLILYFSFTILTIGLDKEKRNISVSVLAYGIIISLIYIVYLCITEEASIYRNIEYLILMTLLLLANIINTKKRAQGSYVIDLLTTLLIMLIFTQEIICIITVIGTLLAIALYLLINKIKVGRKRLKSSKSMLSTNIRIAYIMGIFNILIFIIFININ